MLSNGSCVGADHGEQMAVKAALDSLAAREMISYIQKQLDSLILTQEGQEMAANGSHEFRVWAALEKEQDLMSLTEMLGRDVATVGQQNAFKRKWIGKSDKGFTRVGRVTYLAYTILSPFQLIETAPEDTVRQQLLQVQSAGTSDKKASDELKKRKLATTKKLFFYSVEKGSQYSRSIAKLETDLTAELLQRSVIVLIKTT